MRILGLFDHGGVRRHQNKLPIGSSGRVPGPYCVQMLMDEGVDLSTVQPATGRLHRKVRDVVEHRSGIRVDLAVRGLLPAFRVDGILALLEDKAILPSLLKRWKIPPYSRMPLSVISCWWAEELATGDEMTRGKISGALRGIDRIFCFSRNQVAIFEEAGIPGYKVIPVLFGVDPDFYSPGPVTKDLQVVSAGVDRGRDYESLLGAAALLPNVRFDIFTKPNRIDVSAVPPNVTVHGTVSMDEHRENLRSAELVVVPTRDLAYPTGQSVLLEAMACGACTAVTMTSAMSDYIDDGMINLAIPLADPKGIATVIRNALDSPETRQRISTAARVAAVERFHFRQTWRSVAAALPPKQAASRYTPGP